LWPPFFSEGSRQSKLIQASLHVQGLERANQAFYLEEFIRVIKREYVGGQNGLPRFPIRAYSAPVSFETIKQLFLPKQGSQDLCSLVKTVRDPPSTTRVASSVLCLANAQLVGRRADSRFYNNNRVWARLDSRCLPDSVRASLACSNNLRAATSSCSTEDVNVVVLARDSVNRSSHSPGPD